MENLRRNAGHVAALVATVLFLAAPSAVSAEPSDRLSPPVQLAQAAACPADFTAYGQNDQITCVCPDTGNQGSVWGTATYTNDSAICAAAQHAGLVGTVEQGVVFAGDGMVTVAGAPGCDGYAGTGRNGVATQDYGPWQGSFYFPAASGPGCAQSFAEPLPACPADFTAVATGATLDCQCPANAGGSVWGTWTYTDDSSVCAAARHAGMIGANGGTVHAAGIGGCDSYPGSAANGITSQDYGPWRASFHFPTISGPACVDAPPAAQRYYSIHFVGLQCLGRANPFFLEASDAVLAITFVVEQDGAIQESRTLPADGEYYEGLTNGTFRQHNVQVWSGLAQDVDLHAMLFKYDPVLPSILSTLVRISSAMGGALIAVGTGGAGAVAGVGAAAIGQAAADEVHARLSEAATPLGDAVIDVDLTRVGDPASPDSPSGRTDPLSLRHHPHLARRGLRDVLAGAGLGAEPPLPVSGGLAGLACRDRCNIGRNSRRRRKRRPHTRTPLRGSSCRRKSCRGTIVARTRPSFAPVPMMH